MKFAVALLLLLLVTATSFLGINATANKNGSCPPCPACGNGSWPSLPWPPAPTTKPKTVVVGGDSQKWNFGFNYTKWAIDYTIQQRSPFFVGDTLEFIYENNKHTVVLIPDKKSFDSCDLSNATEIGSLSAGVNGFNYTLEAKKPNEDPFYYFACSAHDGVHCKLGMMKFFVYAWPRYNN